MYPSEERPVEPFSCDEDPETWVEVMAWEESRADYYQKMHNRVMGLVRDMKDYLDVSEMESIGSGSCFHQEMEDIIDE